MYANELADVIVAVFLVLSLGLFLPASVRKIRHLVWTWYSIVIWRNILRHWQVQHIAGNFPISQLPCNLIPAESLSPCCWPYYEQSTQRPPPSGVKNGALCSATGVSNWILGSLSKPLTDWIGTPISSTLVLSPLKPTMTPRMGSHLIPFLFFAHNCHRRHLDQKDVHMYDPANDQ